MKEDIYALVKKIIKLKEKEKPSLFRKSLLLKYLNIEKIAEELQRQSFHTIWDGIVNTFEKINDLRKKSEKEKN
uniref:Uncharacterized protein n=1 Tax=candidate division WOR-3 bacterium TaxID=2052148 RepID=A0A7V3ZTX4_UNCW3